MERKRRTRRGTRRLWAEPLLCLLLALPPFAACPAQDALVWRSATEPYYPPLSVADPDGRADGFAVELLGAVAEAMGHRVAFEVRPWHEIREDLAVGALDILPLVGRTPEREPLFDFSVPYLSLHGGIVVRRGDERIHTEEDLSGKRVAVMRDDNAEEFALRHGLGGSLTRTATYAEALRLLQRGEADAVFMQELVAQHLIDQLGLRELEVRAPISGFRQDFCFAVPEGEGGRLAILNEGLSRLIVDGQYEEIRSKWLGPHPDYRRLAQPLYLTAEEREWIARHPSIPFFGLAERLPYGGFDAEGDYIGIIADYIDLIEAKTGLSFDPVAPDARQAISAAAAKGPLLAAADAKDPRLTEALLADGVLVHDHLVVVSGANELLVEDLHTLEGRRVAVLGGYAYVDELAQHHPELDLTEVANLNRGLQATREGRFAAFLAPLKLLRSHQAEMEIEGLRVVGKTPFFLDLRLYLPKEAPVLGSIIRKAMRATSDQEANRIDQDWGQIKYVEKTNYRHILWVGGGLLSLLAVSLFWIRRLHREVQLRAEAEERVRKERDFADGLLDTAQAIILVLDRDGRIQRINHYMEELSGYAEEEVRGKDWFSTFLTADQKPEIHRAFKKALNGVPNHGYVTSILIKSGERRKIAWYDKSIEDASGQVTGLLAAGHDITEQRRVEQALRKAQKMEAIGLLTGGIAHDFNNLLAIILGNLDLLALELGPDHRAQKRIRSITQAGERAATLTKQLLGFSREHPERQESVRIERLVLEMESLIARSLTPAIEIEQHFAADLWAVRIDPGDFKDALLNLVLNARDAMPDGGRLTIEAANTELDADYCRLNPGALPGECVMLAVSDTGVGIPGRDKDKVFEPFFTRKPQGKGTGLGLAMVYGFAKRSAGYVKVYSEPGVGATFRLYLPRSDDPAPPQGSTPEPVAEAPLPRGDETILVVDDEPELIQVAQRVLQGLGYQVLTAGNGTEALEQLARVPEIALLFSDVVMPGGINGYELAQQATASRPELKILLTSGYTKQAVARNGQARFDANLITKPYSRAELARRVRRLLDEGAEPLARAEPASEAARPAAWSDRLRTGVAAMDADHRRLFELLDQSRRAAAEGREEACREGLERLWSSTQEHFSREEAVMAACGHSGLTNHRQVHRLMQTEVERRRRALDRGESSAAELVGFLGEWWLDHITVMDRTYGPCCAGKERLIEQALAAHGQGPETGSTR